MASKRVRLSVPEPFAAEPVIYRLVTDFDVVVDLRPPGRTSTPGSLVLQLEGTDDAIQRGIAWLVERGLKIDRPHGMSDSPASRS